MSSLADPPSSRTTFAGPADAAPGKTRNLPVLPSSQHHTAMEMTPSSPATVGGPVHSSPDADRAGPPNTNGSDAGTPSNPPNAAVGAAAAAQQPKVVQTAFIHKLYKYVSCVSGYTPLPRDKRKGMGGGYNNSY